MYLSNFKQACRFGSATNWKYLRVLVRLPAGCQCSKKGCQCSKNGCQPSSSLNLLLTYSTCSSPCSESILGIRHATIEALLKLPYDYVDLFHRNKESVCRQKYYTQECDALAYGSLLKRLQELGLSPRKSPDTINISVQDLASQLDSLRVFVYPARNNTSHHHCGLRSLKDKIASTLSSIPVLVSKLGRGSRQRESM